MQVNTDNIDETRNDKTMYWWEKYLWYSKLNGNIKKLSCFGCFIDIDDEWVRYVSPFALFDPTGHEI
jgi:hypothetical protein